MVLFLQGHYFVWTSNLKANIHVIPFQFVKNSYFMFLQGNVATLFRWGWKILSYFVANLSKTLHINFYQNWSIIVEVMIKKFWCVFMPHSVYCPSWPVSSVHQRAGQHRICQHYKLCYGASVNKVWQTCFLVCWISCMELSTERTLQLLRLLTILNAG